MNIALRGAMTVDEYLAWNDCQSERRHAELINGRIVLMAPERAAHNRIKIAVLFALREAVRASELSCEVMTDGMTVQIDEYTAYEPDALVHCDRLAGDSTVVPHPVIIVEVLSPTTAHNDTSAKLIGYFKLPSVAHYLVIDPEARSVMHHTRQCAANLLRSGPLRLDPPGLDLTIEDLLGAP